MSDDAVILRDGKIYIECLTPAVRRVIRAAHACAEARQKEAKRERP